MVVRQSCVAAAAIAVAAFLAAGPGVAVGEPGTTPTPPASPAPPPAPGAPPGAAAGAAPAPGTAPGAAVGSTPAFGAYLDYGTRGVARMAQLSHWLGGADLRVGHTYLPGDRWSNIEGAPGFLDVWADWRTSEPDRMLVLNVPMMERNEKGVDDDEVRELLRQGAAGRFDHHFRALAERLVELKVPDTVLVLGWEMNGVTYTHRCGPDPEAWKTYWNRIVTTMRAVPGQKFRFDFTPSRGRDAVPWTRCYPGDATVDIIGMDSYDQPRGMSFDEQVREPYGLQAHVDFAKAHGKPISYPEWGLFRNGDNAEYMRRMLAWMDEHKPVYNTVTDYCPHGVWQCDDNPRSTAVYRSVLFGRTDEPDPAATGKPATPTVPTAPPVPTAPAVSAVPATATEPSADCSPLELGDWVEYWLGGKLCMRLDWFSRGE
ncbi:glycoside hydrolase family 26 protein [Streptomyces sp. DH41]|uniref:glycoside hydrolase family 26 protein n=1 Tax=Streptomyces sp. DH41 TaxID=3040125 RepID=UPI002442EE4B|nr:glycosyl hydrolase [Streptomyces sp. DH41]MDG9721498.1 glycosyl hydrolase [Streptomyces sp. DH41]